MDSLTAQQVADFRLGGWHAAENGEPDDMNQPREWREGWHLRRFGVLPRDGRSDKGPVSILRRLILASVTEISKQQDAVKRDGGSPLLHMIAPPASHGISHDAEVLA